MNLAVWSDISLMWLILLALVSILPVAVIFVYCIQGLHRLRQLAKLYLPIAQEKTRLVADKTDTIGRQIVSPIIAIQSTTARATGIGRAMVSRNNR